MTFGPILTGSKRMEDLSAIGMRTSYGSNARRDLGGAREVYGTAPAPNSGPTTLAGGHAPRFSGLSAAPLPRSPACATSRRRTEAGSRSARQASPGLPYGS